MRGGLDQAVESAGTIWPTRLPDEYLARDPADDTEILIDAFGHRPNGSGGLVGWSSVDMCAVLQHVLGPPKEFAERYAQMDSEDCHRLGFHYPGVYEMVHMYATVQPEVPNA